MGCIQRSIDGVEDQRRLVKIKTVGKDRPRMNPHSPQGDKLNVSSVKRRMLPKSWLTCDMYAALASGEITSKGTRKPYTYPDPQLVPSEITLGGETWSYQPPQSSHVTIIAVSAQYELLPIALTIAATHDGPPLLAAFRHDPNSSRRELPSSLPEADYWQCP
jgi:hypothetical protein